MSLDMEKARLQATGEAMLPRDATLADAMQIVSDLGIDPRAVMITVANPEGSASAVETGQ